MRILFSLLLIFLFLSVFVSTVKVSAQDDNNNFTPPSPTPTPPTPSPTPTPGPTPSPSPTPIPTPGPHPFYHKKNPLNDPDNLPTPNPHPTPLSFPNLHTTPSTHPIPHSCLDPNGKPVEWWLTMKVNANPASSIPGWKGGVSNGYIDSNTILTNPKHLDTTSHFTSNVLDHGHPLMRTIAQIWDSRGKQDDRYGYLMYNDDIPATDAGSSSYGHTKGVLSFSSTGGYWLIHSHPNFPVSPEHSPHYDKVESYKYGQSYFCISVTGDMVNPIAQQLLITNPQVYAAHFTTLSVNDKLYPDLGVLLNVITRDGLTITTPYDGPPIASLRGVNASHITTIKSRGGMAPHHPSSPPILFTHFAKNTKFHDDLYYSLVSPHYQSLSLYVETWMRPFEKSLIGTHYEVRNVKAITMGAYQWTEVNDHSKWAITENGTKMPIVCIGDINKNKSQYNRAGGTMCINNKVLWTIFRGMMTPFSDAEEAKIVAEQIADRKKGKGNHNGGAEAEGVMESESREENMEMEKGVGEYHEENHMNRLAEKIRVVVDVNVE